MRNSFWGGPARLTVIVIMIAVCAMARIHAQGYAKIVGTVTDPAGAVIPSATVTATQTSNGTLTTVKSGSDGAFVFPALLPSNYSVTASANGFRNLTQTNIVLQADQSLTLTFKLVVDPVRRNYFSVKLWGSDELVGLS